MFVANIVVMKRNREFKAGVKTPYSTWAESNGNEGEQRFFSFAFNSAHAKYAD